MKPLLQQLQILVRASHIWQFFLCYIWIVFLRLGLERGTTAKETVDVIVSLLGEYGQGGNYFKDGEMVHLFHSTFLIVDRTEVWVLETVGKYWAAEKITGG